MGSNPAGRAIRSQLSQRLSWLFDSTASTQLSFLGPLWVQLGGNSRVMPGNIHADAGTQNRPAARSSGRVPWMRHRGSKGTKVVKFAVRPLGQKLASAALPGRVAERTEEWLYVERSFLVKVSLLVTFYFSNARPYVRIAANHVAIDRHVPTEEPSARFKLRMKPSQFGEARMSAVTVASGLTHTDDSQFGRIGSSSGDESRDRRQRHAGGSSSP